MIFLATATETIFLAQAQAQATAQAQAQAQATDEEVNTRLSGVPETPDNANMRNEYETCWKSNNHDR